ncbi:MAG TPA: glycosyltransferase family 4 protein [Novosphingobium sp.]|nr:glycosyltransferase family 4 protein [Novosphingobium sp.]
MTVAVFHPGTQHSWQTAQALQELELLEWYATSIFYQPDRFPYRLERILPAGLGRRLHSEFKRFSHPALDPRLVRTVGLAEWGERLAARAGMQALAGKIDRYGNRQFVRQLARDIRIEKPFALWGYSSSSLETFRLAKTRGRLCVLDRTIGDFRVYNRLMEEVQADYADWFLPTNRMVSASVIANDQKEYEIADVIVVGSQCAAQSVRDQGGSDVARKVRVLPYCFDEALFGSQPAPLPIAKDEPLRFLFVGQANPRKGFHHLLEAINRIPASQASLTVVGPMLVPPEKFAPYADRVNYISTVARSDIPRIMRDHHVLVFPSYFEGSALSLLEGLASGLALIQTPASGNGVTPDTGLLLPRPDTQGLYEAMMTAIEDRGRVDAWRANAQSEASNYRFANYRDNIGALLGELGHGR